jgi:hypothetical protein
LSAILFARDDRVCEDVLAFVWSRRAGIKRSLAVVDPFCPSRRAGIDAATHWDLTLPQAALYSLKAHCLEMFTDTDDRAADRLSRTAP